jgi:hypothetical protein
MTAPHWIKMLREHMGQSFIGPKRLCSTGCLSDLADGAAGGYATLCGRAFYVSKEIGKCDRSDVKN